jgi:hypothetical protein
MSTMRVSSFGVWQYALWGLTGAAANRGLVFIEACARVKKGWPWAEPHGPGGGVYGASVAVHLFLGTVTAAALSTSGVVNNGFAAFGAGVAAVMVVKKAGSYGAAVPSKDDDGDRQDDCHEKALDRSDRGDEDGA